jgi:predicted lipase
MEETILVEEKKEVTVELPYFCKSADGGFHTYKVISKDHAIQVFIGSYFSGTTISRVHAGLAFDGGYTKITEEEFKQVFQKALTQLSK